MIEYQKGMAYHPCMKKYGIIEILINPEYTNEVRDFIKKYIIDRPSFLIWVSNTPNSQWNAFWMMVDIVDVHAAHELIVERFGSFTASISTKYLQEESRFVLSYVEVEWDANKQADYNKLYPMTIGLL